MYYEIIVALNGRHFFATAERSIRDRATLEKVLDVFRECFTEKDGYKITVTKWETRGTTVEI